MGHSFSSGSKPLDYETTEIVIFTFSFLLMQGSKDTLLQQNMAETKCTIRLPKIVR